MTKKTSIGLVLSLALVALGSSCLVRDVLKQRQRATATAEAASTLAAAHGAEVQAAIERYERVWWGIQAHYDPSLLAEVAVGPQMENLASDYGSEADKRPDARWIIATAVTVTHVDVLEYEPQRFKAVADMQYEAEVVTSTGEIAHGPYARQRCDVYVFRRDEGVWKCSARYLLCDEDYDFDWEYNIPDDHWIKAEIGELPSADLCQCRYWWEGVP